jgi:hypothetical protein
MESGGKEFRIVWEGCCTVQENEERGVRTKEESGTRRTLPTTHLISLDEQVPGLDERGSFLEGGSGKEDTPGVSLD